MAATTGALVGLCFHEGENIEHAARTSVGGFTGKTVERRPTHVLVSALDPVSAPQSSRETFYANSSVSGRAVQTRTESRSIPVRALGTEFEERWYAANDALAGNQSYKVVPVRRD